MKKIVFLTLLAVIMCFQLIAGSLDFLKPGEYAYFIDRRWSGEVYYKGIAYLKQQQGEGKIFMVRYVNLNTKEEFIFKMLIDDSTDDLLGNKILGEYGESITPDYITKKIAIDFIYMLQFYIDNEYRIKDDINLLYRAPNIKGMQLATLSSPRFKVLRLGKILENGKETPTFEIDRMGDLKTQKDVKAFKKYMPK